jgi:hypothetical protein
MTRRWLPLAAVAMLAACGRSAPAPGTLLPETVSAWKRTTLNQPGVAAAGGLIPAASIRRVIGAAYTGAGSLEVTLYDLASSAAALDAVQRWRPAANAIFFYQGRYFVIVQYHSDDRKALNGFVRDLSQLLAATGPS